MNRSYRDLETFHSRVEDEANEWASLVGHILWFGQTARQAKRDVCWKEDGS